MISSLAANLATSFPIEWQDKIVVHMIHHSHDDVGWLETVD
jgi:hypothetical protein